MARADGRESAVEMSFDGADGQAGDIGDFGEFEFFEETKEEDAALALGELTDALPDERHLLTRNEARFKGAVAVGNVSRNVGYVDGRFRDFFPETETVGARVVADEVEGDAHEPSGDGAVSAKGMASGPGANKGVLREGLGEVAVADGDEVEAEDALLVGCDDRVHVVERRCCRMAGHGIIGGDSR